MTSLVGKEERKERPFRVRSRRGGKLGAYLLAKGDNAEGGREGVFNSRKEEKKKWLTFWKNWHREGGGGGRGKHRNQKEGVLRRKESWGGRKKGKGELAVMGTEKKGESSARDKEGGNSRSHHTIREERRRRKKNRFSSA